MSAVFIVNQDRDRIYRFNPNALMYTAPVWFDGVFMAANLMMGGACLGTFDSAERAIQEASSIYNYQGEIYAVTGFSDWRAGI